MDMEQYQRKTLYVREKISGIWMIRPCQCQQEGQEIVIKDGAEVIRYTEEEFRRLCENGTYAESPREAYDLSMKEIEGSR